MITSFRVAKPYVEYMDKIIDQAIIGLKNGWKKTRTETLDRLEVLSPLWERFLFSFEELIHLTFAVPSLDQKLTRVLQNKDYQITGFLQLMASRSESYESASVQFHIEQAKKTIEKSEKIRKSENENS